MELAEVAEAAGTIALHVGTGAATSEPGGLAIDVEAADVPVLLADRAGAVLRTVVGRAIAWAGATAPAAR